MNFNDLVNKGSSSIADQPTITIGQISCEAPPVRKRGRPTKQESIDKKAKQEALAVSKSSELFDMMSDYGVFDYTELENKTSKFIKLISEELKKSGNQVTLSTAIAYSGHLLGLWKAKKLVDFWEYYSNEEGSVTAKEKFADMKTANITYYTELLYRLIHSLTARVGGSSG